MKKLLAFGLPLTAAWLGAGALRWWQRTAAFEPDTGLLTPGHPATWCLLGLFALAAAIFALLGRRVAQGVEWRGYLSAFALPHRPMLAAYLLAGGLLLGAGVLGIGQYRLGLNGQLSRYLLSIALVPTGLDLALVGWLNAQREEAQGRFAWPLVVPGWCGCVWLIAAYQHHTAQPDVWAYAPYFLGAVCAVAACYAIASFSFERPRPAWCLWLCAGAEVLLATAVVDAWLERDFYVLLVCLGFMAYLAAQLKSLLYRAQTPAQLERWEPPAAEEEPGEEKPDEEKEEAEEREAASHE